MEFWSEEFEEKLIELWKKTYLFIIVWTVVQIVLTATFNYYGDRQISTPHKINTPELIDK